MGFVSLISSQADFKRRQLAYAGVFASQNFSGRNKHTKPLWESKLYKPRENWMLTRRYTWEYCRCIRAAHSSKLVANDFLTHVAYFHWMIYNIVQNPTQICFRSAQFTLSNKVCKVFSNFYIQLVKVPLFKRIWTHFTSITAQMYLWPQQRKLIADVDTLTQITRNLTESPSRLNGNRLSATNRYK